MPELPEVEHAARALRTWLVGVRVTRAEASPSRVLRSMRPEAFSAALLGRRCERVERRGKTLLLGFDAGLGLLSHLGMSGRWLRRTPGEAPPRHDRARLHLEDGAALHYDDPRMFGRLLVAPAAQLAALPELTALGPDPLLDGIDPERLGAALVRTTRPVKVALMDPTLIAGVGNIQAAEALFRAGVHPAHPSNRLSRQQVEAVAAGIEASIAHTLASLSTTDDVHYLSGGRATDNPFLVYGRVGTPCPRCGAPIETRRLAGRSSAYCPRCQPAPPGG
ncbi:bifunctional DNA-formamidopyrimidine glycosylase/DNA-(apurinic or apyrimidinic site) lyase [Chondromyces crocatus]|uniref:Formamidopyrimidine-DNA glycosylase n=1 Tax=Chondromyces crocatus TaxID=52 RepID=A0A0K1E5K6_CHOCO|nr:bifunctional DNA-formamidopyrimidine glycosylase/DNA-(apurinic or apyrimidinic site) lyase [Chondromyces crocatus]AKT36119.1 formamidopyrimidine-DNA glycosylase [Chondromyces crocatus]